MSVGQLSLLSGVGGFDEIQVQDGDDDNQVLIVQRNKVMVMKLSEASILHTWYGNQNQNIVAAVRNQDVFEECSVVVGFGEKQVALVNNLGSKINAFKKITLAKRLTGVLKLKGDHLGVMADGSLASLSQALEDDSIAYSEPVLSDKEKLLEARLVDKTTSLYVVFVVEENNILHLVKSRLMVSDGAMSVSATTKLSLGTRSEIQSWDIYSEEQPYVILWNKSGSISINRSLEEGGWTKVFTLENCNDTSIAALSPQYFAIMYTKHGDDGGHLDIVSIDYQVRTSEAKLKTTVHKGRGLHYVRGHLFGVGGGRIVVAPVSDLNKEQDEFLGVHMNPAECEELPTALQLYGQLPNLYKIGDSKGILNLLQSCIDVPEDILVDYLNFISSSDKHNLSDADRLEILNSVFTIDFSDTLMQQELSRLSLDQVLLLLETVCSLLQADDLNPQKEKRLFEWLELLLDNNYVQIVLAKDEKTSRVMGEVCSWAASREHSLKEFSRVCSTLSLMSTISPDVSCSAEEKLPYDIQIIEI